MNLSELSESRMPQSSDQDQLLNPSRAIATVLSYIAANNRHDIEAVLGFLAEDIEVIGPNLATWASSKEAVKPFYLKDFARAKKADLETLIKVLDIREDGETRGTDAHNTSTHRVQCVLENLATSQIVDVVYVLRSSNQKMVKHIISSIEDSRRDSGIHA